MPLALRLSPQLRSQLADQNQRQTEVKSRTPHTGAPRRRELVPTTQPPRNATAETTSEAQA